jgi:phospholipid-translocating ATPase
MLEETAETPSPGSPTSAGSDPAQATALPSDKEHATPKVRFSEDLNRITASASTSGRLGTPALTIDTAAVAKTPTEVISSSSRSSQRKSLGPSSPRSPASPRTRDRGYSLRRTLFARGIDTQFVQSPVELAEAGPSEARNYAALRGTEAKGEKPDSSFATSIPSVTFSFLGNDITSKVADSISSRNKEKKTFGTLSLPNYDIWARAHINDNEAARKIYGFYKDKIYMPIFGQSQLPPSKDGRHIDLDASQRQNLIDERTGKPYVGNVIRSSRYTIWDFVPRQLWFQFSKLANAYFLLVSVLQMVPGLSPVGSYTTIAPLLVFIAISMGKEGWDDLRRYKLDKVENNTNTLVLNTHQSVLEADTLTQSESIKSSRKFRRFHSSKEKLGLASNDEENGIPKVDEPRHWATLKWKDVQVGDIIKLSRDEPVPADIVLLHADGFNGIAYIETMALDGETNLKTKQAPTSLAKRCKNPEDIAKCRAHFVVEDPNLDLYNFNGRVTVDGETLPLTTNEIVFRGSTLRNTSTVIGMVINAGEECKIRMNANKSPRIKTPAMQAISNKIVVLLVIFVILLSLFCSIAYQVWTTNVESDSWYIKDAHIKYSFILVGFIILFNTLIPLSLYVSLEIIKVGLLLLMKDVEMYDPVSDTPMVSIPSPMLISFS